MIQKITVCLLFLFSPLFSQAEGADDATSTLYDKVRSYNSLVADFKQRIIDRDGVLVQESEGSFSLAKPNKVHWKTLPPYEQEIIGDEQTLWVYDADLEQATRYSGGELLQGPMALFSENLEDIQTKFTVSRNTRIESGSQVSRYTLQTKQSEVDQGFNALVFEFRGEDLSLIEIHDRLRQVTAISLSNLSVNIEIPDSAFVFVPPVGVAVLESE